VPHTETEVVGRNTATGELLYQQYNKPIPCMACKGEGRIPCQECNGSGIDPELRLRSAARLHSLAGSAGNGIIGVLGSPGLLPGGR
jgi:hypothetical protein